MTPSRAILAGTLAVNGPVFLVLFGPSTIVWWVNGAPPVIHAPVGWYLAISFLLSFPIAWLWWSIAIPHWRVWAYERVDDIPRLKAMAVIAGLTWPDGWIFERTEIKSKKIATREAELLELHDSKQRSPNNRWRGP